MDRANQRPPVSSRGKDVSPLNKLKSTKYGVAGLVNGMIKHGISSTASTSILTTAQRLQQQKLVAQYQKKNFAYTPRDALSPDGKITERKTDVTPT